MDLCVGCEGVWSVWVARGWFACWVGGASRCRSRTRSLSCVYVSTVVSMGVLAIQYELLAV